jgi:hypothetical protein
MAQGNLDVLNNELDINLENAEREQSAGSFKKKKGGQAKNIIRFL